MNIMKVEQDDGVTGDLLEFERAVQFFGGVSQTAAAIGCAQPHISKIRNGKRTISLDLALRIQEATGDQVLASALRPDKAEQIKRAK